MSKTMSTRDPVPPSGNVARGEWQPARYDLDRVSCGAIFLSPAIASGTSIVSLSGLIAPVVDGWIGKVKVRA